MRQLALALLLLPFMSLSQASASECGFKADNKTVDPNSMVLCPNNKSLQLLTSSYGEGVMVFTKDQDETYAKIQNEKSESQLRFDESNQEQTRRDKEFFRSVVYIIALIAGLILIAQIIFNAAVGNFADKKNESGETVEARYSLLTNLFLAVFAVGLIGFGLVGPKNSLSIIDSVGIRLTMIGNSLTQYEMQLYTYMLQTGGLEKNIVDPDTGVKDDVSQTQAAYTASAWTEQLILKAIVARHSSQHYNDIFYKSDSSNWVVSDSLYDLSKKEDVSYTFEKYSPKGDLLFELDPVTVFKSELNAGAANSYFQAVRYDQRYRDEADLTTVEATANQLKNELLSGPFDNNRAGYEDIKNTAMSIFYRDSRANTYLKELPNDFKLADNAAVVMLNLICAENLQLRMSAKQYIDAHNGSGPKGTGSIFCVGDDWKVKGEENADVYKKQLFETRKTLETKLRDRILAYNDAFSSALTNDSSLTQLKKMLQEGDLTFLFYIFNYIEDTSYTSAAQNMFNDKVLIISERKAVDFFLDDEWARGHGYDPDYSSAINISQYVRTYFEKTESAKLPNIVDSDAISQKLIFDNGTAAGMNKDLQQGAGLAFEMPMTALQRCKNTITHPLKCYQMYATSISKTASDLRAVGLSLAISGQIANDYANSKLADVQGKSSANIGKKDKSNAVVSFSQTATFIAAGIGTSLVKMSITLDQASNFLRFLPMLISILPFFVLLLSHKFVTLMTIQLSPFFLLAFCRLNDADNFASMRSNLLAFASSIIFVPSVVMMTALLNWEVSRVILLYTDSYSHFEAGGILDNVVGFVVEFIKPVIVSIVSTTLSLHFLNRVLNLMNGHVMFSDSGERIIAVMISFLSMLSFGSVNLILKLSSGLMDSVKSYNQR
ncbi:MULTISPECIES: hypothetical protein [unclassified Pseudomonas]|uniref:hypothetical protein n=1 Tax=unclassified Pseudomonas TaxID=196821 RepID=UPI000D38E623|nr:MULTISPECIES: hypothetical protein [unclassified Pseudomonas]PTT15225.1 hypothetical protein DBR14_01325 [Pseudomonas sp. HMWF034]PVV78250.1 hypothetical protein DD985_01470 [Pseudomonas sp. HMWF011]